MRINFNIEDPVNKKHLQKNSFKVPSGYFNNLRTDISDKISTQKQKIGFWTIVKPQLGLVSAFILIFLFAYGIFQVFPAKDGFEAGANQEIINAIANSDLGYVEEGFLNTTFIDFFDTSLDSLTTPKTKISEEELVKYLSENIDLITLSYLDLKN